MEEFLAEIFVECMVLNKRFFSETDFKSLLRSQRLDDSFQHFNDKVIEYISRNDIKYYYLDGQKWSPKVKASSHVEISKIIQELQLHLEVEFSLDNFCDVSCDVVQKINNYLWLGDDEAFS